MKGAPLTIFGDGSQTRSFCYVDDLIEGIVRLMSSEADLTGPVNLGNPVEFTIAELAELVLELTGTSSRIKHLPLPQDDPRQRKPDITLATRELDWQPKMQLREGLMQTIAYFDRLLSWHERGPAPVSFLPDGPRPAIAPAAGFALNAKRP